MALMSLLVCFLLSISLLLSIPRQFTPHIHPSNDQQEHPDDSGYSDEIRDFLKWYHFAAIHIPEENKEIDMSTLV